MKAILIPALFSFTLSIPSPADVCREVVRDSSGRIVQTIDRQKSAGDTVQATMRDASGGISSEPPTLTQITETAHKPNTVTPAVG